MYMGCFHCGLLFFKQSLDDRKLYFFALISCRFFPTQLPLCLRLSRDEQRKRSDVIGNPQLQVYMERNECHVRRRPLSGGRTSAAL